mmetsp:Transcript_2525/g.4833  ORF Transcript_2525/g.4833 Transcript_2525/m.4833 type:complete len:223 (-) Transcript_2525:183-851(-)
MRFTHEYWNLVVCDGVEEVVIARVKARVHHGTSDTKHSSTSILDLNIQCTITCIGILNLSSERVSSRDGSRGSIISAGKILGSSSVFASGHGNSFSQGTKKKNLDNSERRNVGKSRETHAILQDISEGVIASKVKRSGESDSQLLNHHTDEGSHGNTSMLDLDGTTTREALNIINETKGIEEVKRTRVNSKTIWGASISVQGSLEGSLGGGGGKRGGRGDES